MALSKISTVTKRKKLTPRKPPYFDQLYKYAYVGFRKSSNEKKGGSWVAKYKNYNHTLGIEADYDYERAIESARQWIKSISTITDHQYSMSDLQVKSGAVRTAAG